jgi:Tfp pilus assembly protein PilW
MTRQARSLRQRMKQDEGTSLIELVVGMMLMAIFLGMFTGAIVMMNTSMNKSQAVNLSSSQLNTAFASLDNTVRYAAFISTPGTGTPSGDWYVELRVTNTGSEVCSQLRVDIASQQLQRRVWTVGANGNASTPGAWVPISSGISNGNAPAGPTQPFLPGTLTNGLYQQLTINLTAPAGSGSAQTNSMSTFTLTALNSALPAPTSSICQQAGRP